VTLPTRRHGPRAGAALLATGVTTTAPASPRKGDGTGNGKAFGRVEASGTLWRANVVTTLDGEPDPGDALDVLHDGSGLVVGDREVGDREASPFVSESAPGDQDWNGGQWVHCSIEIIDIDVFNAVAPLAREADVLRASPLEVTLGRPGSVHRTTSSAR
jgi:hypothetical protein